MIYSRISFSVYLILVFLILINPAYSGVDLQNPSNNAVVSSPMDTFLFEYNVSMLNPDTCDIYIGPNIEGTDSSIDRLVFQEFTVQVLTGLTTWRVECTNASLLESSPVFNIDIGQALLENITINNIGVPGIGTTNPEYTGLRTVILDLDLDTSATQCRIKNLREEWSIWDTCEEQKYWILEEGDGLKTVWIAVNHTTDVVNYAYDTITLDSSGQGLDITPPLAPTITDDGDYTNKNQTFHAGWSGAYDRESELLNIPLIYYFRIQNTNWSDWHLLEGNELTVNTSLDNGDNYSIEIRVVNSANLSNTSTSNGIVIDLDTPMMTFVTGSHNTSWTKDNNVSFSWNYSDSGSGIYGYSFLINELNESYPDTIPEGIQGSLDELNSYTFFDMASGEYYFHIMARDNAGNWGGLSNSDVFRIDTASPSIPRMDNAVITPENGIITFYWTASNDIHSGISHYFLQVAGDEGFTDLVYNDTVNETFYAMNVSDGIYYAKVRAVDNVGRFSLYSDHYGEEIDVTPPIISIIRPFGLVMDHPSFALMTDEYASCYYVENNSKLWFGFTNGQYHETKIRVEPNSYTYEVSCIDSVGLISSETISFEYQDDVDISDVEINTTTYFAGQIAVLQLTVTSGSSDVGEVAVDDVSIFIDDEPVDFTIHDKGKGEYDVSFVAPKQGTYSLQVSAGSASDEIDIEVNDISLTVTYTEIDVESNELTHLIYVGDNNSILGFASDSRIKDLGQDEDTIYLQVEEMNNLYIFFTTPKADISRKEYLLEDGIFLDLINPAFGLRIKDENLVGINLAYEDIILKGSLDLPSGRHSLIIRNNGLDNDGNSIMEVKTA